MPAPAMQAAGRGAPELAANPRQAATGLLYEASWQALGTSVIVRVCEREQLAHARAIVESQLGAIDRACSRFRADSELSRVNRAGGRVVPIGPLLCEALSLALWAAQLSEGRVDPTVGRALALAGYDRDYRFLAADRGSAPAIADGPPASDAAGCATAPRVESVRPSVQARFLAGWSAVELDDERGTVRVPAGVQLDLGATAKAWAADRACEQAFRETGVGVLVGLGGDIAMSGPAPRGGWQIRVTDDHRAGAEAEGQTIAMHGGGLATSSTAVRRWRQDGRSMHHILDPRTGQPLQGRWRTVSVAASSCAHANIASTAALIRGHAAEAWLARIGMPARLVDHLGRASVVAGWPATEDRQALP